MSRLTRITLLLMVLVLVMAMTLGERLWVRGWSRSLEVAIYPIALDSVSVAYVDQLQSGNYQEIESYLVDEGRRWKKSFPAPHLKVMKPLREPPPLLQPQGALEALQYSLRLRWYGFRHTPYWTSLGRVRMFVLYHEPTFNQPLPHSFGLQKGLLGVVHVFASDTQQAQNNIVIAHELLHTLGATDKYDVGGQPRHPQGYADLHAYPLLPQQQAEIMAGRIPVTEHHAIMPRRLADTVIGYATAAEIGW
jgi:hypothetical protein